MTGRSPPRHSIAAICPLSDWRFYMTGTRRCAKYSVRPSEEATIRVTIIAVALSYAAAPSADLTYRSKCGREGWLRSVQSARFTSTSRSIFLQFYCFTVN
jgi:hypothetical protein